MTTNADSRLRTVSPRAVFVQACLTAVCLAELRCLPDAASQNVRSAQHAAGLKVAISEIEATDPPFRLSAAMLSTSLGLNTRLGEPTRKELSNFANSSDQRPAIIANLLTAESRWVQEQCADDPSVFDRVPTVPMEQRRDLVWTACGLDNCPVVRDVSPAIVLQLDPSITLIACTLHRHLESDGGVQPLELELLRELALASMPIEELPPPMRDGSPS